MKIKTLTLLLAFFSAASFSSALIDVMSIVGKTQVQIADILGTPTGCSKSKYGQKCSYAKAEIEIVFIKGKADWITIEGIDNVPFNSDALKSLGLSAKTPIFSNNFTMKWVLIQGLKEVTIFKGAKNSDYAYIKSFTK